MNDPYATHRARRRRLVSALCALLLPGTAVLADEPAGDEKPTRAWRFVCPDGEDCEEMFFLPHLRGGYLGVELTSISEDLRAHFGAPRDTGVMIGELVDGGPAAKAGLAVGDIVTAVDGEPIHSASQLGRAIRTAEPGTEVTIEVIRDRRAERFAVTLGERERLAVDMSRMIVPSEHFAEAMERIDWSQIQGDVAKALEGIDWEGFAASTQTISGEAVERALEGLGQALDSQHWETLTERLENIDYDQLEAKMEALRERLQELEQRLEERERDQ